MSALIHLSYLQQVRRSGCVSKQSEDELEHFVSSYTGPVDDRVYIRWSDLQPVLAEIAHREPAGWARDVALSFGLAAHGPLGYAALSADNLYTACKLFEDHVKTRVSLFDVQSERHGEDFNITLHPRVAVEAALLAVEEMLIVSVYKVIEAMLDTGISAMTVYSRQTANHLGEIGMPVSLQSDGIATIRFPASWLSLASSFADATAFQGNTLQCEHTSRTLDAFDGSFRQQIENLLIEHLDSVGNRLASSAALFSIPSMQEVSQHLHCSSRTLIRRLHDEGTSYREILADLRKVRAETYLREQNDPVEDIAYRLGYTDTSNFIRAFRQWNGVTPAVWRKQIQE